MKRLVIPTDLSPVSLQAIEFGLMLCAPLEAIITVVYVCEEPRGLAHRPIAEEKEAAREALESLIKRVRESSRCQGIIDFIIKEGRPYREVLREVKPAPMSYLVLSRHGLGGEDRMFPGGNAYRILAGARTPAFLIPAGFERKEGIRNIVLPLDESYESLEKLESTSLLAKLLGATVHVVLVTSGQIHDIRSMLRASSSRAIKILKRDGVPYTSEILIGSIISDLSLQYAREVNADLISIMSEREKSAHNSLIGPYAHHIITRSDIPVLVHP
ncbi:MAG TPA: universal stress protein [Bacteroidales bacterium]|nr:universal stress protein [Lentimicrobiaceae bacterium]HOH99263.1 universal stress protein [Bacteroidales bacterium]